MMSIRGTKSGNWILKISSTLKKLHCNHLVKNDDVSFDVFLFLTANCDNTFHMTLNNDCMHFSLISDSAHVLVYIGHSCDALCTSGHDHYSVCCLISLWGCSLRKWTYNRLLELELSDWNILCKPDCISYIYFDLNYIPKH